MASPRIKSTRPTAPGLVDLANMRRNSVQAHEDLGTLIRAVLLFWMLGVPDGHAKNFSIALLAEGRYRMTPVYDVMSDAQR